MGWIRHVEALAGYDASGLALGIVDVEIVQGIASSVVSFIRNVRINFIAPIDIDVIAIARACAVDLTTTTWCDHFIPRHV